MTTYDANKVSDTVLAHKKSVTIQVLRQMRDNAIATAEGAATAPVLAAGWHPYDMVTVEDGADGEIWSFANDGAVASIETPDFADGYEYMLIGIEVSHGSNTGSFDFDLFRETDAAYTNDVVQAIVTSASSGSVDFICQIELPRVVGNLHSARILAEFSTADNAGSDNTGGHVHDATDQPIGKVRMSFNAGNVGDTGNTGQIIMLRRREYQSG